MQGSESRRRCKGDAPRKARGAHPCRCRAAPETVCFFLPGQTRAWRKSRCACRHDDSTCPCFHTPHAMPAGSSTPMLEQEGLPPSGHRPRHQHRRRNIIIAVVVALVVIIAVSRRRVRSTSLRSSLNASPPNSSPSDWASACRERATARGAVRCPHLARTMTRPGCARAGPTL